MEVLIVFVVFSAVTAWILGPRYMKQRHEERMRALGGERTIKALSSDKSALEARVEHLESIVCSLDFELNAKLNRIATHQLMLGPAARHDGTLDASLVQNALPAQGQRFYTGELEAGARIADRYVIELTLGSGGMGAVYRARDEKLGERVALKVVRDAHLASPSMLERFRREVTTARRIHHPNVVRIHDLGEAEGVLFISMEYVDGESLRSVFERYGRLPLERVRALSTQILAALQAAHEAGVVHRDLKPENVLLDAESRVRLIDFGIARLDALATADGLTATHAILGTPQYMAPEQIRGRRVDARTDLYALGVMLYEALCGRPPFTAESPIALSFAHCTDPVPPLPDDVPSAWRALVERALAKEPDQRFASAAEMRGALPAE